MRAINEFIMTELHCFHFHYWHLWVLNLQSCANANVIYFVAQALTIKRTHRCGIPSRHLFYASLSVIWPWCQVCVVSIIIRVWLTSGDHGGPGGGGLWPHQGAGGRAQTGLWHVWQVRGLFSIYLYIDTSMMWWWHHRPHVLHHGLVAVIKIVPGPEAHTPKPHVLSDLVFDAEALRVVIPHLVAGVGRLLDIIEVRSFRNFIPNSPLLWVFWKI